MPPPRELHDGRYLVDAFVAAGRWGDVYRGRDVHTGDVVALKRCSAWPHEDPRTAAAKAHTYAAQRTLVGRLQHPHLVAMRDAFSGSHGCWMVMDYVAGSALRRVGADVMAWRRVVRFVRDACAGLDHAAAAGILHRDLKPEHLLVDEAGRVRLTDFVPAIAGIADDAGTPAYFAPERLRHAPATVATDIYALGVVCYELLTGHRPYAGATVRALAQAVFAGRVEPPSRSRAAVPVCVDAVVLQALALDAARRPASWREFAVALDRCLANG